MNWVDWSLRVAVAVAATIGVGCQSEVVVKVHASREQPLDFAFTGPLSYTHRAKIRVDAPNAQLRVEDLGPGWSLLVWEDGAGKALPCFVVLQQLGGSLYVRHAQDFEVVRDACRERVSPPWELPLHGIPLAGVFAEDETALLQIESNGELSLLARADWDAPR